MKGDIRHFMYFGVMAGIISPWSTCSRSNPITLLHSLGMTSYLSAIQSFALWPILREIFEINCILGVMASVISPWRTCSRSNLITPLHSWGMTSYVTPIQAFALWPILREIFDIYYILGSWQVWFHLERVVQGQIWLHHCIPWVWLPIWHQYKLLLYDQY